jgi:hypothetical protein
MRSFIISTPSNISTIKTRTMRWAGLVAHMEEKRNAYNTVVKILE